MISDDQIAKLAEEAAQAGDTLMVELCREALDKTLEGPFRAAARNACARAIAQAAAMNDT